MNTSQSILETISARVGQELGVSGWKTIDQAMIDAHAATTGDRDWLHNEPERAARESPFDGKTIAQGSLLLSLLVSFQEEIAPLAEEVPYSLNYGYDRVRFIRPVLVDSRVRARMILKEVRPKGVDRAVVKTEVQLEVEGSETPHVVAEWLGMVQLG